MLTLYLVVLLGIPSTLRITALGSMGSVGVLLGLVTLIWWVWYRAQLREPLNEAPSNPVRIGLIAFAVAILLSYLAAMTRAIPSAEISPADTGLLRMAALIGVAMLALDGPPSTERFHVFIRRFALAGALIAALGLAQFVTEQSLIDQISIPGFSAASDYASLVSRGGLTRPSGTSLHPLEYAAVLSMTLPIAVVCALHARGGRAVALWMASALIFVSITISSSRSAYVGLAAALVPMILGLGRTARAWLLGGAVVLGGVAYLAAPRAITNLRYLFESSADDPSVHSRTSSYEFIEWLMPSFPLFGRGVGTFLPEYRIFDNQYLVWLVEAGIVGLLTLVALLICAVGAVLGARRRTSDGFERDLGIALIASLAAATALLALFDTFSFPQAAGTLFLVIGLCGSYRRLLTPVRPAAGRTPASPVKRLGY